MNSFQRLMPDITITLNSFLLLCLGILVIYSSDSQLALMQAVFAVIGFGLYWFISKINLDYFQNYTKAFYITILLLLIVVFILGIESRGSIRWIPLGPLRFQPSEFAKPVLILCLAQFWANRLTSWKNIVLSLGLMAPFFLLIFKQPDLGTALTLAAIWLGILISANIPALKLILMATAIAVMTPVGWLLLHDYQKNRIFSFLSPSSDPLGVGYNVIQSTIAVGSGELLGRGLGRGTQSRLQFLPEFRTDFIFASIAEEFGFLGSAVVLVLYGFILMRLLRIVSYLRQNRFASLVILGVMSMLIFQITINIGMNIGILPITGITLPLISYGGSSVIATLICLGFVSSRH